MNLLNIFNKSDRILSNKISHNLPKRFWTKDELGKEEYERLFNDYLFNRCLSGADFIKLLDENFTPFLKNIGYKGGKNHFYKSDSNLLFAIGIFKDKYGGECSLNVGVHIVGYPIRGFFEKISPSKVTTNGAMIRKTLELSNGNSSLKFGTDIQEGLETIEYMKTLIEGPGLDFFNKFTHFPKPFSDIELNDFIKPNNKFSEFNIEEKMLKWIHFQIFIARFNFDFGDKVKALQILSYAREQEWNVDRFTSKGVSPLLPEIDKLIDEWK